MSASRRRRWSAERKLRIVLETLQSEARLAEICRRQGVSPHLVYAWRKRLLGSAETVFAPRHPERSHPKVEKLAAENARLKSVITRIRAENLELKKRSRTE